MDKEDGLVRERPAIMLLRHLREVWPEDEPFVPTTELIGALVAKYPTAWGEQGPFGKELTAKRLARMLATSYKVNSTRIAKGGPRGYALASLHVVWRRMRVTLPDDPVNVAHPAQADTVAPDAPGAPDAPLPFGGPGGRCPHHPDGKLAPNGRCISCIANKHNRLAREQETTP